MQTFSALDVFGGRIQSTILGLAYRRRANFERGESRSNDPHESRSDPESQLYRKSNAVPAVLSDLGQVLTDNRHSQSLSVHCFYRNQYEFKKNLVGNSKDKNPAPCP